MPSQDSVLSVEPVRKGSEFSERINAVIADLRQGRAVYPQCFVVRQGRPLQPCLTLIQNIQQLFQSYWLAFNSKCSCSELRMQCAMCQLGCFMFVLICKIGKSKAGEFVAYLQFIVSSHSSLLNDKIMQLSLRWWLNTVHAASGHPA